MKRAKFIKTTEAYGLLKTSLKYQTKEFFNNSTLHGVRYIAEEGRSFGEKFMWFCFVSIGAVAAFVIIGSLWEKFQTNPTLTGLDTDFHNQKVYFPTVTICPLSPSDSELVNETALKVPGSSDESFEALLPLLKSLPELSYFTLERTQEAILNMSGAEMDFSKYNVRQLAFTVGLKCEDLLEICKYKDEEISCCEFFYPVYSEHGLCYSFNPRYLGKQDDEVKNDRINNLFETDKKWALTIIPTKSAKVFVHSTDEVTSHDYRPTFMFDVGYQIDLLITMKQTYTTDDARQLSIGQRKCIFPDEVKLKYYKNDTYSFTACMKQCRMEKANKLCKCIPPFYTPASGNYRRCGLEDFTCLVKHRDNITDIRNCRQCELSCLNTVYDIEKFSRGVVAESSKRDQFYMHIEFLTWPIIRYKREVLFGWVDLLVSFGGIAGLFLGFSLLSGVEIIYYFTMRAGCMMYKNRDELYVVQEEEKLRSIAQYDLGLTPKLRKSDKMKSLSMPNVQAVKPVKLSAGSNEAIQVKAFDSPKVPIKIKDIQINTIKRMDDIMTSSRLQRLDVKSIGRKKFVSTRQNLFRPIQVAPYSQLYKKDKKFRLRSHSQGPDVMFDGYLP